MTLPGWWVLRPRAPPGKCRGGGGQLAKTKSDQDNFGPRDLFRDTHDRQRKETRNDTDTMDKNDPFLRVDGFLREENEYFEHENLANDTGQHDKGGELGKRYH